MASYETMNDSENAEAVSECTEIFKTATKDIEAYLEKHNFIVVINTYEYYLCNVFELMYSDEELDKVEKACDSEEGLEAIDIYREAGELVYFGDFKTQAEFDAFWKKALPFFDKLFNCLDGDHPYGEYVSNNDATEEADGTKTATCEFCGATDTITDEGTKLVKDDEPKEEPEEEKVSFFEMIFALIKEFFEKIFSIFK